MWEIYNIHVWGRVQGVNFRKYTHLKAKELGIKGWVKNEDDGSVSITAEGETKAMEDFLIWCQYGPELAKVTQLKFRKEEGAASYEDFVILR